MKQIQAVFWGILSLVLFAGAAHAAKYEIKICKVSLAVTSGISQLGKWHHSYVKSATPDGSQTLNFDPVDRESLANLISGPAEVTNRDWRQAHCVSVFDTDKPKEFNQKWGVIEKYFKDTAKNTNYSFYDGNGKNCHYVAHKAIIAANLEHPFPEILNEGPEVKPIMELLLLSLNTLVNYQGCQKDAGCNPM